MFEHKKQPIIPKELFLKRVFKNIIIALSLLFFSLLVGIFGYHYIGGLPWVDSFMNASMILGGMGPVDLMHSSAAKLFAGFYALFSGVVFLSSIAVVLAPILHRFLHKFHIESED